MRKKKCTDTAKFTKAKELGYNIFFKFCIYHFLFSLFIMTTKKTLSPVTTLMQAAPQLVRCQFASLCVFFKPPLSYIIGLTSVRCAPFSPLIPFFFTLGFVHYIFRCFSIPIALLMAISSLEMDTQTHTLLNSHTQTHTLLNSHSHSIPVVSEQFLHDSIKNGKLLPNKKYRLDDNVSSA